MFPDTYVACCPLIDEYVDQKYGREEKQFVTLLNVKYDYSNLPESLSYHVAIDNSMVVLGRVVQTNVRILVNKSGGPVENR